MLGKTSQVKTVLINSHVAEFKQKLYLITVLFHKQNYLKQSLRFIFSLGVLK